MATTDAQPSTSNAPATGALVPQLDRPMLLMSLDDNRKWKIHEDALARLATVPGRLKVVSIIGKYRTGKSFFLNRMLDRQAGFALGHLDRTSRLIRFKFLSEEMWEPGVYGTNGRRIWRNPF